MVFRHDNGGNAQHLPSDPVAFRLRTGTVEGRVFYDINRDGGDPIMPGTGINAVLVRAYEAGTTTLVYTIYKCPALGSRFL